MNIRQFIQHVALWDSLANSSLFTVRDEDWVYISRRWPAIYNSDNDSDTISDKESDREFFKKDHVGGGKIMGAQTELLLWQMNILSPALSLCCLGNVMNNRASHLDLLLAVSGNLTHAQPSMGAICLLSVALAGLPCCSSQAKLQLETHPDETKGGSLKLCVSVCLCVHTYTLRDQARKNRCTEKV